MVRHQPDHPCISVHLNSPYINRLLSADTIVPGYANPQNLNRLSYVRNNSLRYIDPTGHRVCDDFDSVGNGAHQLNDLRSPPANRLKALKGYLAGFHSVRVND